MFSMLRAGAIAALLALTPAAALAVPATKPAAQQPVTASLYFDPPIGQPLRYRYEKAEESEKGKEMVWSVARYTFAEDGEGYRLTVTPESSGFGELELKTSPAAKALMELAKRPYTLLINADAEIVGMVDAEAYWKEGLEAFAALKAETDIRTPAERAALDAVVGLVRQMPDEVKLSLLTEGVAPLVEFANTETTAGDPIRTKIESPAPFGGVVNRDVVITLDKVKDGIAHIAVHSSVPREALNAMVTAMVQNIGGAVSKTPGGKPLPSGEIADGIAALEHFSQEARGEYQVSTETGLLERFRSTETVEVREKGKTERKVTSISLERID